MVFKKRKNKSWPLAPRKKIKKAYVKNNNNDTKKHKVERARDPNKK